MHGEDRKRVRDCGKAAQWLASDHGAIKLMPKLKTKLTPRRDPDQRAALTLLDRSPLRGKETSGVKARVVGEVAETLATKGLSAGVKDGSKACVRLGGAA
jgi:hypothetical protein